MAAARARSRSGYGETAPAKPRSDVYVGLLLLSLVAQFAGAVFLFMDYKSYPDEKPPALPAVSAPQAPGGPGPGKKP